MANAGVPDFTLATSHVNQAAAEFTRQFQILNTTPAVQLQEIGTQLQQINRQLQQMNRQFDEVKQSIAAL